MNRLIHNWIEHHAARKPDADAASFLDEKLSYATLDLRANQLAHTLIEQGVTPGDRVGIYMDKNINTPVALYGILKSGAAFVPLDPSAPVTRTARVIDDAGIRVLISNNAKRKALRQLLDLSTALGTVMNCDAPILAEAAVSPTRIARSPTSAPPVPIAANDMAYIMYTSGSTGTPKGIMHSHHSGLAFAARAAGEYGLTGTDRLSNHAPLHFDLSIFDYFSAAVAGAATVIIPEEYTKLPASYAKLIDEQRVSVLFTVPFALIQLLLRGAIERFEFSALRWVIFGGEPYAPGHLRALMDRWPHVQFDNMYGPAEVNGVTHYVVPPNHDPDTAVPIGPVATTAIARIVDGDNHPVSPGQIGELWIHSPTMMLGYWQRKDLDAAALVQATTDAGETLVFFRTGDLVSADASGVLTFAGRKDRQVKVRGYRVELDEVELALSGHDEVEEAAVYTLTDAEGVTHIHALATIRNEADADKSSLIRYLKEKLPWYAMPSNLGIASTFPRTTSGKIDRRALAHWAADPTASGQMNAT